MSKRYGRNQKRQHREEMRKAMLAIGILKGDISDLNDKCKDLKKQSCRLYVNDFDAMDSVMNKLLEFVSLRLGDELSPYAKKLFEASGIHNRAEFRIGKNFCTSPHDIVDTLALRLPAMEANVILPTSIRSERYVPDFL